MLGNMRWSEATQGPRLVSLPNSDLRRHFLDAVIRLRASTQFLVPYGLAEFQAVTCVADC
jgi:hypothetical protein